MAKSYAPKLILLKAAYFVIGILSARGVIFGRYFPFGLAVAAAAPEKSMIFSMIGVVIGYFFTSGSGTGMRYISTVIAIAAIRWTLNDLQRVKSNSFYAPFVALVPTAVTGIALDSVDGLEGSDAIMGLTEAVISAGAAYFFDRTFKGPLSGKQSGINQRDIACLSISMCISVLSLIPVMFGVISLGRVLGMVIVLLGAYCAGVSGGGISGIAAGTVFGFPSFGFSYISGTYAFGGMMAGICSEYGKISLCGAFLVSSVILLFQSGDIAYMISGIYEILLGIILFLLIPHRSIGIIKSTLSLSGSKSRNDGTKLAIVHKLNFMAESILGVRGTIEKASSRISGIQASEVRDMRMKAVYSVCGKCRLRAFCWERESDETRKILSSVARLLESNEEVAEEFVPEKFRKRCSGFEKLVTVMKKCRDERISRAEAENRIEEIRTGDYSRFGEAGCLVSDMAREFDMLVDFDGERAIRIENRLKHIGVPPLSVLCEKDSSGRIYVDIQFPYKLQDKLLARGLFNDIGVICARVIDEPIIRESGNSIRVQLCERTILDVDIGVQQHVCNDGKLCGDNYSCFNDGKGNFIAIISDGMGTGGRAAVDGAISSEIMESLIKSGMGFESTVRIINSALLARSGEESLAAMDIVSINLFTGKTNFMKAGAPATFVRRGKKTFKIDMASLPIGILSDVKLLGDSKDVSENDWILMVSDGVTDTGDKWIEDELNSWNDKSAQRLSSHIVLEASKRREGGRDDDITAIAIRIKKRNWDREN